jgi:hypothetical protein
MADQAAKDALFQQLEVVAKALGSARLDQSMAAEGHTAAVASPGGGLALARHPPPLLRWNT